MELGLAPGPDCYNLGCAWARLKKWVSQAQQAEGTLGSVRSREGWEPFPCLGAVWKRRLLLLAGSSSSVHSGPWRGLGLSLSCPQCLGAGSIAAISCHGQVPPPPPRAHAFVGVWGVGVGCSSLLSGDADPQRKGLWIPRVQTRPLLYLDCRLQLLSAINNN